jgi:hypothetical protein
MGHIFVDVSKVKDLKTVWIIQVSPTVTTCAL